MIFLWTLRISWIPFGTVATGPGLTLWNNVQSYVRSRKWNVHEKRLGSSTQTFHKSPLRNLTRGEFPCTNIRRHLSSPPQNLRILRHVRNRSKATTILESEYSVPSNLIPIFLRIVIVPRLFVFWERRLYPPIGLVAAVHVEPTIQLQLRQRFTFSSGAPVFIQRRPGKVNKAIARALGNHLDSLCLPQDVAPPSPGNGVCIPQRTYSKGTGRGNPDNQGWVLFIREDGSYLPVQEALDKNYGSLMDQDSPVLDGAGLTVIIRFEWPGYQPREYQLRTIDWRGDPKKVPLRKLATDVAKIVKKFVNDMQGKPIDANCAKWRVGEDAIRVEDLRLAAFEQVSAGSWQTRLFYMAPN